MAKVAKVDHQGKTIRQFQVHGSKVRLCQAGGQTAEEMRKLAIQPGMLPDFPDSEVSGPLYQLPKPQEVSVQPEDQQQEYDIPDEALRTEFRADPHAHDAPQWLPVEDSIMQDVEPREEYQWKVPQWLERSDQTVHPEDSASRLENEVEPMVRANHGASDGTARKQLWKHAQRLADQDGKPRIPVQPSVKGAPEVESLAARRRGVSAERQQHRREASRRQAVENRRVEDWERQVAKSSKRGKRSSDAVAKKYNPPPIKLSRRYEALREEDEYSEADNSRSIRPHTTLQSGYPTDNGMYRNLYEEQCEESNSRPHRGGKGERGRQVGGRNRRQERVREQDSSGRRQSRERERERAADGWRRPGEERERWKGERERRREREWDKVVRRQEGRLASGTSGPSGTHTHSHETRTPHAEQTDTQTHTQFDRSCLEHSQYTNTTLAGPREHTLDMDNNAYTYCRTDLRMDVGGIGRTTNTHTNKSSGFSQGFLNFLAGAPLSRQEHTADKVANEQLNWSNEGCASESINSEISSQLSISSNESQCEQSILDSEFSHAESFSNVELPNELNSPSADVSLIGQSRKNNVEYPNELMRVREERVSAPKDASCYRNEAEMATTQLTYSG